MEELLKVGVIGVGSMGRHHVRVYHELGVNIVGVADADSEKTRKIAAQYGTKAYSDYIELLNQGLDAVSIAVPTIEHKAVALAAIEQGVNLLIEKPIADTIENAQEIIKAASGNEVKLMVGHIERFNPVIATIKGMIKSSEIISIDIVRQGPVPPRIKDVGVVIDLAVHDIDIIRYLTGSEFVDVHGMTSRTLSENEDTAIISLRTENGILCHITTNWLTPFKVREISIATQDRFIKGWLTYKRVCEYRKWQQDNSYIVRELSVSEGEPLRLELEAFVNAIINNTEPPVTGEDGLKALEIAVQCLE